MAIKPLLSQQQRVTYADEEETKLPEPVVPGVKEDQPQTQLVSDGTDVQVTPIMPGQTSAMGPAAPVTAAAPEPVVPEVEPSVANVDTTMPVESAPAAVAKETNVVKRMIDMIKDNLFGTGEQQPLDKALSYAKEKDPEAYQAMDGSNSQQLSAADASFTKNPPKTEDAIQAASVVKGFKIAAQHKELGDEGLRQQIESDGNPLDRVAGDAYLTALALGRPPWKAAEDAMKAHQTAIAKTAEIQAKVYEDRQVIEQQAKQRAKAVTTNTAATERAIYKKASSGFYKQKGADQGDAAVPAAKIAQGLDLIKVGIETGDFESVRKQLTENGLDYMIRDLDQAEARYNDSETLIRGTSLKSGKLGPTSTGEAYRGVDGRSYRETIVNGKRMFLDEGGRQVSPDRVKELGLEPEPVYSAGQKEFEQAKAKSTAEYSERINNTAESAAKTIGTSDTVINIVGRDPDIVGIMKQNPGAFNALLNAVDKGIGVAGFNINLPVKEFVEKYKLSPEQQSKLEVVANQIASQRLNAQQALRGLGSVSDRDAMTAWSTVGSTDDTAKGLIANMYLSKSTAEIAIAKQEAWDDWKQGKKVPDRDAFERNWRKDENKRWKEIRSNVQNYVNDNVPIPGYEDLSANAMKAQAAKSAPAAPAAPAAPGAGGKKSSTVSEGFEEYYVNGKRRIRKKEQ